MGFGEITGVSARPMFRFREGPGSRRLLFLLLKTLDLSSRCRAYPVTNPFQSHVRGKCGLDARGPSAGSV